ncbi:ArdC-like ssDNA-binding domain-containing protein [Pseudodesulfovibrio tunisiensis]
MSNSMSGTVYRGINLVLLGSDNYADPRFLTLRQVNANG